MRMRKERSPHPRFGRLLVIIGWANLVMFGVLSLIALADGGHARSVLFHAVTGVPLGVAAIYCGRRLQTMGVDLS